MTMEPSSILLLVIAVGFALFIIKQVADLVLRLLLLGIGLLIFYVVANRLDISYTYLFDYLWDIWEQIIAYIKQFAPNLR